MELFYTKMPELCRNHSDESDAARTLLRWAYMKKCGEAMPDIVSDDGGKPGFSTDSLFLSISHSHGHILVGLDGAPLGVDIELDRDIDSKFVKRLFSEKMQSMFTPLEGWTLREAVFKLTGKGSLRDMEFSRDHDCIISPFPGVSCRLYHFDGCTVAAAGNALPETVTNVPWEALKNS